MRKLLFALFFLPSVALAQEATDIFLADFTFKNGTLQISSVSNLTDRDGYDNQPSFSPDSKQLYYTSMRDGQTDVYRYDFTSKTNTALIATPNTSEYSPMVMPKGKSLSVLRVEEDSTQRVWKFDLKGKKPKVLTKNIKKIGYYSWMNEKELALFILDSIHTLKVAEYDADSAKTVYKDIGRCLHQVPGKNATSFVDKMEEQIMQIDHETGKAEKIMSIVRNSKDYVWFNEEVLIMAQEGLILYYNINGDKNDWKEVERFETNGNISRLAVSPDKTKLVFVMER